MASKGDLQAMLNALGAFESGIPNGDPRQYGEESENEYGFIGKYQFGESLLTDLGYYQAESYYPNNGAAKNEWKGTWTGKGGMTSKADFFNSPQVQETAIREAFALNFNRLEDILAKEGKSVNDYLGQVIAPEGTPITITLSGLLAGAHLRGPIGVADLLLKGIVAHDEIGTPITKYVDEYGGYEFTAADLLLSPPPGTIPPPVDPTPVDPTPIDPTPTDPTNSPLTGTNGDDELTNLSEQGGSMLGLSGNDQLKGGLGDDTLDGGAGDDLLYGEAGHDTLLGQEGNDSMSGGLGNDSYTVDSSTDTITELIAQGHDIVLSSISYALADNLEELILTGNNSVNGTGNSFDNIIIGNIGNNYLYAGEGKDQIDGQAGDDYLYGQAGDDFFNGGEGIDWLVGEMGDDIISGGAGNDRLFGGLGNDTLSGDGGKDRLTGGADADRFMLNLLDKNFDIITDFQSAQGDKVVVSIKKLGGDLKRGRLLSDRLTLGSTSDHTQSGFVYDSSSGRLFFDADGIGGQKQVQLAKLAPGSTLTSSNIVIAL